MHRKAGLALVVGAGPGMGLALAKALAGEGFDLALVVREGEPREPFELALAGFPVTWRLFTCDAGDAKGMAAVLEQVAEGCRPVEVLIFNASRSSPALPSALDPAFLLSDLEIHLGGAVRSVQAVLPGMRARGRGTILLTGGGSALHPKAQEASLGIGKGAMRTLALLLAEELEPEGIHVATVTIDGFIQAGTVLDPALIARHYLELHAEPRGTWRREVVVRGLE